MRHSLLVSSFVILVFPLSAQSLYESCPCQTDLKFVTDYLEHHYSGFASNVTSENRPAYEALKKQLISESNSPTTRLECLTLLNRYLAFFRDRHLGISIGASGGTVDENSADAVRAFRDSEMFKTWEHRSLDSAQLYQYLSSSVDPIEGIYEERTYKIAVIKDKTERRDYAGFILGSRTPLWDRGQLKLELLQQPDSSFRSILYLRNHSAYISTIKNKNPVTASFSASRAFPLTQKTEVKRDWSAPESPKWFSFQQLNDSTNYLYIGTFDGSLRSKFDSAYSAIEPKLKDHPNLIIDIRNNGGGSDGCWQELGRLLYTQPYQNDQWDYFASPEVIKRYEEQSAVAKKNEKQYGHDLVQHYQQIIRKLKKAKSGTFVKLWPAGEYKWDRVSPFPKRVVLMFNRGSASAAEGLILSAMHSKKVITFGENSGGYITFGNIMVVNSPSGFQLRSGTNRTQSRFQYETNGIPPQVRATPGSDWIAQAQQLWSSLPKR